jgi:hypothetical protein
MESKKMTKSDRIREALALNPDWNNHEIASLTGATATLVSVVRNNEKRKKLGLATRNELRRKKLKRVGKQRKGIDKKKLAEINKALEQNATVVELNTVEAFFKDAIVDNPPHYTVGGISTYDFIKAKQLSYELGNVVKYVSRADFKGDPLRDLQKARWYLNAAIRQLGEGVWEKDNEAIKQEERRV